MVSGPYGAITDFIHRIETLVTVRKGTLLASGRLFSVNEVAISGGTGGHQLTATLTVDAFAFGTVPGATPLPVTSTSTTSTSTTGTSTTSTTTTSG